MLSKGYEIILEGQQIPPSWIVAQLPASRGCPTVTEILSLIKNIPLDIVEATPDVETAFSHARWEMVLRVKFEESTVEMRLAAIPSEKISKFHLEKQHISPEDISAAEASTWSLGLSMQFGETPLHDYHRQLKVLYAFAHEALLFLDLSACRAHNRSWVEETAASKVPPHPDCLFAVHAVFPEEEKQGIWLHTHGLLRCGITELEILEVPFDGASLCGQLLNVITALFIERGMPPPNEIFAPAAGMDLLWLPWEQALNKLSKKIIGGHEDRDDIHGLPSAVLLSPKRGVFGRKLRSPAVYLPILEKNPLFFISDMETERMRALASERFQHFADLFQRFHTHEAWAFLVKLGYSIDGAKNENDREHLWFKIHSLHPDKNQCEATLLNEPYSIARMHEGQRDEHDLVLMSDWAIDCHLGRIDPDSIFHLHRTLAMSEKKRNVSAIESETNLSP